MSIGIVLCIALLPLLPCPQGDEGSARLRCGYLGESNIRILESMQRAGMNSAMVKFGRSPLPIPKEVGSELQQFSDECARLHMAFIPVINWWGDNEPKWAGTYDHFVTSTGTSLPQTPCPYSLDFWNRYVTARFLAIAGTLKSPSLAALCIDPEMYGGDTLSYGQDCYCDKCFARYLALRHRATQLPPVAERARLVDRAGDVDAYRLIQRDTARQLSSSCREAISKAQPGLRIGVLNLDLAFPFYEGLALGFGTSSLAAFCFTERTYDEGFSPYIAAAQQRFKSLGAAVDLIVGIFQSKFAPQNLAEQLYYCAKSSGGYWIFTMDTFANPDYQPLAGTPREYWDAIKLADIELRRLTANPKYVSSLAIGQRIAPPPAIRWGRFVHYDFLPKAKALAQPLSSMWLRRANWVYFWAKEGDSIDFEVSWRQLGNYQDIGAAGLVSPSGEPLAMVAVRPNEPGVLRMAAPQTGNYAIAFQAGLNAVEITRATHPFSVQAPPDEEGAFLSVRIPRLFLPIVPGATRIIMELVTPVTAQAVRATVSGNDGTIYWSGTVDGVVRVAVDRPHGPYLRIDADKLPGRVLQDFHIKASEGLVPLAATEQAWLLQPRD